MSYVTTPDPKWAPRYYTKPLSENAPTRGEDIREVGELFVKPARGYRAGEPLVFAPWQEWGLDAAFEEKPDGYLRYRIVLFGLPRKNGKSLGLAQPIVLERLLFGNEGTEIFMAAHDRDQAKIVHTAVENQIKANAELSDLVKIRQNVMTNTKTGAKAKAVGGDSGARLQGYGPELAVIDELHEFNTPQKEALYNALTSGSGDRPESLVIIITTAGENTESLLGRLWKYGKKVAAGEIDDPSFGFFWWGAGEEDDPFDPEVWRKANPNLAEGLMSEDYLKSRLAATAGAGDLNAFLRFHLNVWARTGGTEFITPFHWEKAARPGRKIPKGARVTVGFDGSLNSDSTAFVLCSVDDDEPIVEISKVWHRDENDPNWIVPRHEVLAEKNRIFEEYDVALFYGDQSFFQTDFAEWADEHYPIVQAIPQSQSRMAPMAANFKMDIVSGALFHADEPDMGEHVQNAVMKDSGMIGKEQGKRFKKIDLAVAALLANGARHKVLSQEVDEEEVDPSDWFL